MPPYQVSHAVVHVTQDVLVLQVDDQLLRIHLCVHLDQASVNILKKKYAKSLRKIVR